MIEDFRVYGKKLPKRKKFLKIEVSKKRNVKKVLESLNSSFGGARVVNDAVLGLDELSPAVSGRPHSEGLRGLAGLELDQVRRLKKDTDIQAISNFELKVKPGN